MNLLTAILLTLFPFGVILVSFFEPRVKARREKEARKLKHQHEQMIQYIVGQIKDHCYEVGILQRSSQSPWGPSGMSGPVGQRGAVGPQGPKGTSGLVGALYHNGGTAYKQYLKSFFRG